MQQPADRAGSAVGARRWSAAEHMAAVPACRAAVLVLLVCGVTGVAGEAGDQLHRVTVLQGDRVSREGERAVECRTRGVVPPAMLGQHINSHGKQEISHRRPISSNFLKTFILKCLFA